MSRRSLMTRCCAWTGQVLPSLIVAQLIACGTPSFVDLLPVGLRGLDRERDQPMLGTPRPLTFAGRRSSEAYYSADGREIVFQSEREADNPFLQTYRMSLETGEARRVSTGQGRTTCGWLLPGTGAVLFASTHLDPDTRVEQTRVLADREAGTAEAALEDFDEHYDLFLRHPDGRLEQLTRAIGYDAEGTVSPDGRAVVFASNRAAFAGPLSPETREHLAERPADFVDLYLLDLDSRTTQRLTDHPGYDGGAVFSPDGESIVWRRFSEDRSRAELHSMRRDGSDERVLTRMGVRAWAPFYHPSGDYIAFTARSHGPRGEQGDAPGDAELYLVDVEGRREPVRVTRRPGFDGLPAFSPDGDELIWTSDRTASGRGQIFRGAWNDSAARRALRVGEIGSEPAAHGANAMRPTVPMPRNTHPEISPRDIAAHVHALTDSSMQGRRAGTQGERVAADYLARTMRAIGLEPGDADGDFLEPFGFAAGIGLGEQNALQLRSANGRTESFEPDRDWRPLAFSRSGEVAASAITFVGYGLVAPATEDSEAVDAYAGLDVRDRWVLAFRDMPRSIEGPRRAHLQIHASLRYKAMAARDRGARGILFVSGPASRFREELVPLRFDASMTGTSIAVLSISNDLAQTLLAETRLPLREIQARTDGGFAGSAAEAGDRDLAGFITTRVQLSGQIDLETRRAQGHNVVGRLRVGPEPSHETVVLGAHFDHLGHGLGSSSLARARDAGEIHPGADDNASGVAVLIEIAERLADQRRRGDPLGGRDFVFAAWSGEELGLLGSDRWAEEHISPPAPHAAHATTVASQRPVAYLNFDMVGRLEGELVVQGLGSSSDWARLLEAAASPLDLALAPQNDAYLPTDATSFYTRGIPVINAFTGVHADYHTPRDIAERLNYAGAAHIAALFLRVAEAVSRNPEPPIYAAQATGGPRQARAGFRIFLGTVPDYAQGDVVGVRLSGVAPAGPAERAGMRSGDVIVEVDGRPIENLYDYTYSLDALRVGEGAEITVLRGTQRISLEVVPDSRD